MRRVCRQRRVEVSAPFDPGPVDAPHWMDEAAPKLVEKNLRRVIALRH